MRGCACVHTCCGPDATPRTQAAAPVSPPLQVWVPCQQGYILKLNATYETADAGLGAKLGLANYRRLGHLALNTTCYAGGTTGNRPA